MRYGWKYVFGDKRHWIELPVTHLFHLTEKLCASTLGMYQVVC